MRKGSKRDKFNTLKERFKDVDEIKDKIESTKNEILKKIKR